MKNIILACVVCIPMIMNAQITLTSEKNVPDTGSTFVYISGSSPNFSFRQGGANTVWDFSSISGDSNIIKYVSLSESSNPTAFPTANTKPLTR